MAQMYFSLLAIALVGILLHPEACFGLGINCRGSSNCSGLYNLNTLVNFVCTQINQANQYKPGVRIASQCKASSGIAAFTQNTSRTITAGDACNYLRQLQNHGCKVCGSVPFGSRNNVDDGELTVNYVSACG